MHELTLRAVVNCLIPPDEFPGAYEAGVCDYVTRLFETDVRDEIEFFATGLACIESEARALFGESFANLSSDQQVSTLTAIEHGEVTANWPVSPQRLLNMLVCVTAEGFYSNPQQGGNRDSISWRMTGFEQQDS